MFSFQLSWNVRNVGTLDITKTTSVTLSVGSVPDP
jgi:hypothetical protein